METEPSIKGGSVSVCGGTNGAVSLTGGSIQGCKVHGNTGTGVFSASTTGFSVLDNWIYGNGLDGISVDLGSTIVGSFQDELPDLPTWSREFSGTFQQSFGYRLEEVIHRLFEAGDADARRTRDRRGSPAQSGTIALAPGVPE